MPEPAPTKFTNLDATTTWCRTCDLAVSMPHEHPITVPFAAVVNRVTPTKPTPTVIASDKALAARWFRSSPGDISAASALEAKMATEIAATREAWGAELTAELQGLREIATSGPSTATGPTPLSHRGVTTNRITVGFAPATMVAAGVDKTDAVALLVEVATKALYHWNEGHDHDACEVPGELRAAPERVKGDSA